MLHSWRFARAFGIGLFVHPTFLLLPLWVAWNAWESSAALIYWELFLFALFGCVLLHELGHALAARCFGIETRDITMLPIGGVARLERMIDRPGAEFWIALAGPAVNGLIALLLGLVWLLGGGGLPLTEHPEHGGPMMFVLQLLAANVTLLVFNLAPAFPMDGGRVVRALLSRWLGVLHATEIAAAIGFGMLVVMVKSLALPMLHGPAPLNGILFIVLGLFVFLMGLRELRSVQERELYRELEEDDTDDVTDVEFDFSRTPLLDPPPADDLHYSGLTWNETSCSWVEWRDGRAVQAISIRQD